MRNQQLDDYTVQQVISRLIIPFERWDAYRFGIIDAKGRVLKKKASLRTKQEQDSWGYIDIMCCNLKKILNSYPTTQMKMAQLNNILTANLPTTIGQPPTYPLSHLNNFFLLKEENELKIKKHDVEGGYRYEIEHNSNGQKHTARVAVIPNYTDKTVATIAVFSDHPKPKQKFKAAVVRQVMKRISADTGVKTFIGGRITGAGRGRQQEVKIKEEFVVKDHGKFVTVDVHDRENNNPYVAATRIIKGTNNRAGGPHAERVRVDMEYRGKGVANQMYDKAEEVLGQKLVPSHTQSSDAQRMWKRRLQKEDAPANSAGGGAIAGIGVGPQGEPPVVKKNLRTRLFKRLQLSHGNC